jgi:hypothetical protein
MVKTALAILVIELGIIGWVRWRYGARSGALTAANPTQPTADRA